MTMMLLLPRKLLHSLLWMMIGGIFVVMTLSKRTEAFRPLCGCHYYDAVQRSVCGQGQHGRRHPTLSQKKKDDSKKNLSSRVLRYYSEKSNADSRRGDSPDDPYYPLDGNLLQQRLQELRIHMMEQELRRPPNPHLSPTEVVTELLHALWNNTEPLPDSGFRLLLRASTPAWRQKLYQSVGAPWAAQPEVVASAMGQAMARPNNQFALLVGEAEPYVPFFPMEPLDYADGTSWLECRLRHATTQELLVVTGWNLEQRESDGAWLVAGLDWQDFRDEYRPGIGREEWMRICG